MNTTRPIQPRPTAPAFGISVAGIGVLITGAAPATALTARSAVDIDVGYAHSCAVTNCGEVKCWGRNDWNQSLDMSPTVGPALFPQAKFSEVSVGQYHTCALDKNQKLLCWGKGNYGQTTKPAGNFVAVDAGYNHNCALDTSGAAVCWGANDKGQSNAPAGSYKSVSAGRLHSCAVTSNGQQVNCWGSNAYGQARTVSSWDLVSSELFAEVSAGDYHTCARTTTQRVYCWGYDALEAVSGGGAAHDQGGGIYRHAYNAFGAVSAGGHSTLGLVQDGPSSQDNVVWAWGWPHGTAGYTTPIQPPSAPTRLAAGYNHGCVIDHAGDVACFGNNTYGKSTPDSMAGWCGTWPLEPIPLPLPLSL